MNKQRFPFSKKPFDNLFTAKPFVFMKRKPDFLIAIFLFLIVHYELKKASRQKEGKPFMNVVLFVKVCCSF